MYLPPYKSHEDILDAVRQSGDGLAHGRQPFGFDDLLFQLLGFRDVGRYFNDVGNLFAATRQWRGGYDIIGPLTRLADPHLVGSVHLAILEGLGRRAVGTFFLAPFVYLVAMLTPHIAETLAEGLVGSDDAEIVIDHGNVARHAVKQYLIFLLPTLGFGNVS